MVLQKCDTVVERHVGRKEVLKLIEFGMQDVLKGSAVGDDIIESATCVLGRQQVCNL